MHVRGAYFYITKYYELEKVDSNKYTIQFMPKRISISSQLLARWFIILQVVNSLFKEML